MSKISIFIEQNHEMKGEKINIIYNGLLSNDRVEITNDIEKSDYIFVDISRDYNLAKNYKKEYLEKTIIIDYSDLRKIMDIHCLKYFKRSVVKKNNLSLIKYNREVIPISYCLRQEVINFKNIFDYKRDTDISIFFRPANRFYRTRIAGFIKDHFSNYNIHVGLAGKKGVEGRNKIQNAYFNKMFHSKIVITCNPCKWEGDYRTWEALASGALVIVDKMITPIKNPLIDRKHVIFYDRNNLEELKKKIIFYLENDELRKKIAKNGYYFTRKYHKPSDRIDEILCELSQKKQN